MRKFFAMLPTLALCAMAGNANAAGSLWSPDTEDFPALQVRTPNAVECWSENSDRDDVTNPCYEKSAGWWFGYTNGEGHTAEEYVLVELDGQQVVFEDVKLTDEDGVSLIGNSLKVELHAEAYDDAGAGFGFNHIQEKATDRWDGSSTNEIDISDKGGYCLTYSLSGTPLQFVLGWDESGASNLNPAPWKVWYATLTPGTNKTVNLPWSKFEQDNWGGSSGYPLEVAQEEAVSVKIRLNGSGDSEFELFELGWAGECDSVAGSSSSGGGNSSSSSLIDGGSLWGTNTEVFPALQVRTPDALDCWSANTDREDDTNPCYEESAGWWFGYTNNESTSEKVQVELDGVYKTFNDVKLTDDEGNSLIDNSLKVKIDVSATNGGAGFGFNHKQEKLADRWNGSLTNTINISNKSGYCLTYSLSGTPLQFVLGWDESAATETYTVPYNVWYATLTTGTRKTVELPWDVFDQDTWGEAGYPIRIAKEEAVSVKIRLNTRGNSTFELFELGWAGECEGVSPGSSSSVGGSSSSKGNSSSSKGGSSSSKGNSSSSVVGEDSSSSQGGTPILLPQIANANKAVATSNGINLQVKSSAIMYVYNLDGKLEKALNFNNGVYNVKLGDLPKGMYIVKTSFGSEKQTMKVIIK